MLHFVCAICQFGVIRGVTLGTRVDFSNLDDETMANNTFFVFGQYDVLYVRNIRVPRRFTQSLVPSGNAGGFRCHGSIRKIRFVHFLQRFLMLHHAFMSACFAFFELARWLGVSVVFQGRICYNETKINYQYGGSCMKTYQISKWGNKPTLFVDGKKIYEAHPGETYEECLANVRKVFQAAV